MATTLSADEGVQAYDELWHAFQWDVPERYNFAVDTVGSWAADSRRLALLHLDAILTI